MRLRGWVGRLVLLMGCCSLGFPLGYAEEPITQAQPPLPSVSLTITDHKKQDYLFTVELAKTPREQEIGEMFRKEIPAHHGMLFIWPAAQESAMWMKNTYVPLDIIFIDEQNRIHAIEEHTIPLSEGIISSHGPVRAVLELPAGTTESMGIVVGDHVVSSALPSPVK